MGNPDSYDIDDIQHFLSSDKMTLVNDRNETANALIGADRGIWGTAENKDTKKAYSRELVVLRARKDIDTLSRTIGNKAIDWIMKCGGRRWKKVDVRFGKRAIHDETIFGLTFWFTSGIASILPVVSIILLVKMESLNGRLGLIATFNVIISLCLTLFTEARRTDVFAVTAAYDRPRTYKEHIADKDQIRRCPGRLRRPSHRESTTRSDHGFTESYTMRMLDTRFQCSTNSIVLAPTVLADTT